MSKLKPGAGKKAKYGRYSQLSKVVVNARKKLQRHLKKYPNDEQAQAALGSVSSRTTRKAPGSKNGWVKDSLRNAMTYVPYLNGKGQVVPLRVAETLPQFLASHGQSIAQTKDNLKSFAQVVKLAKKAPFRMVPVLQVIKDNDTRIVMRHDSKLSNFNGKVKLKK